jgi:Skp family chaperone for outer membrane proteins
MGRTLVAVGVALLLLGPIGAEDRPLVPAGRVALVNLAVVVVMHNYKSEAFRDELRQTIALYRKRDREWKAQGDALAQEVSLPTISPARRAEVNQQIDKLQRLIDDNNEAEMAARTALQERQRRILYTDLRDAVRLYAERHGLELVLQYSLGYDPQRPYGPNLPSKLLEEEACWPMYYGRGIDISGDIIAELNEAYLRAKK